MGDSNIKYDFKILSGKKIFHETIYGFWNAKIASDYARNFSKAAAPLIHDKWAGCLDLRKWNPSNPSVMKIFSDHFIWAHNNKMKFIAIIVTDKIPMLQMKTVLHDSEKDISYDFFKNETDAFKWLNSKGF